MRQLFSILGLSLIASLLPACANRPPVSAKLPEANARPTEKQGLRITSAAFKEGQRIPRGYTCDGANVSPPLEWSGMPANAKTLAIVCDDPDAPSGTWVHWVLYDLPADNIGMVENMPATEKLAAGGFQGKNDFGKIGYGGPCPPQGTHRYFFKLYALDSELPLKAGLRKADLLKAMEGHIVAQAQLIGTYRR